MVVTRGDLAPDFVLPGVQDGLRRDHSLAEHRGRPVVLVFYPGDNTPVCTVQLNTYTSDLGRFDRLGVDILAISPQDLDSHESFARSEGGFGFPLLADVDEVVAEAYGVLGPLGFYRRSIVVVDEAGRVSYVHRGHAASNFLPTSELVKVLDRQAS
ncbi:MAG: peroxiredoxin [Acidimicrobiales bacterium]|nr:peroxiredoxin [Acidimicrobiales bacterium]